MGQQHLVTFKKVGRNGAAARLVHRLVLVLPLVVHGDGLLHGRLLRVPFLRIDLGFQADDLLSELRPLVHLRMTHEDR